MGAGQKIPFSKFLSHISYNDKTWHSHTFPKEDQKKKKKKKKIARHSRCDKRVKTESHEILGDNSCVCRSYRGNTDRGPFGSPPILSRVKISIWQHVERVKLCVENDLNAAF